MLTSVWSIEHVYNCPAALSVLHHFRYISVLSKAWDQYPSTNSLPNVQGEVYLSLPCPQPAVFCPHTCLSVLSNAQDRHLSTDTLPNVQGEVYLSLPCPQLAVFRPCMCPSTNIFTGSRLKMASGSPAGVWFHLLFRIFGSFSKDYMKHFTFGCRHPEFIVCVFLNMFNHMYAILKHCYFFQVLWLKAGFHLSLGLNKLKSHQLLSKVIVGLPRRLQKLTGRVLYKNLCQSYDGMRNGGHM